MHKFYSINNVNIASGKLAIGSSIYSCSYFKEINRDGTFHVIEDCQHHLLY